MKKILCIMTMMGAVGCQNILPYVGTQKQTKEFSVNGLQLFLITNRDQFPVTPKSPKTLGMWLIRYGLSEEIWVCAEVNGDVWTPEPGILEHELLHALNNRDKTAIQNPDRRRKIGTIDVLHETTEDDLWPRGQLASS